MVEDIESIELELDELQADVRDAVPRSRLVPERVRADNRFAIDPDANRREHSVVDQLSLSRIRLTAYIDEGQ